MSEMSPLLRFIAQITRLTIMVIAALLVLLIGLLIGFHQASFSNGDWVTLVVMVFLAAFAMILAWALGRQLRPPIRKD